MMKNKFFAVGLSEHRLWGLILIPIMIRRKKEDAFYTPDHTIFPSDNDENFLNLSHTEKEIVKIIDQYNDKNLFKLFSKEKTVREFQEKVSDEKIEKFIRPYIEQRIVRVTDILKDTSIKIFFREKTRSNIFDEDFLQVLKDEAQPVFNFYRGQEGSKYTLELQYKGKKIYFKDKYTDIIANSPAIIRINRKILTVKDIEAKKILPFFSREFIFVPAQAEARYFKTFLLNLVKEYEVNAEGFSIKTIFPKPIPLISIEKGIDNNAVLVLRFSYGNRILLANSKQQVFVEFHKKQDQFYYEKFHRDMEYEESVHELLNDLGLISYDQVNYEIKGNRQLEFADQLFDMLEWICNNREEIDEAGLQLSQKVDDRQYYTGTKKLNIQTELKMDWFDIHAVLEIAGFEIPFARFRKHILNLIREYELPNGEIFIIPKAWFARFREMFEFSKTEDERIHLHKQHFFIIDKITQDPGLSLSNLEKLNKREDLPDTAIPAGITARLRPYQAEGYKWMYYLQQNNLGGCLADDMGLGKTLQAICLLQKNKEENHNEAAQDDDLPAGQLDLFSKPEPLKLTSLIVVPASLIHNWINELLRFAPGMKVYAFTGPNRSRNIQKFNEFDVIVSTYHTVRSDIELLSGFAFHTIILDESQVIKNPSSKVYRAVNMLNSKYRLALTGTPIENSLTDLWSQMNFVNGGLLGNLSFFRKEYVIPIERKSDNSREEKLNKLINPFILRRTKEEVAKDLPEINDQVIYCSMSEEQRKFYEEEKSGIRNSILANIDREGLEHSSMIVLQGLTRLRQISNHPVLVDENYRSDSGKFSEILRNIENVILEGHKVLVFSSFVKHLNLFERELNQREIKFNKLTGETTKREDIVKSFQENPDCKVFLISLKAGGVGLNLTAADYVFILDPWWNPASEDQAVNRAHRIGQDKNVFVCRFISENSIEEKIQKLQQRKSKLADTFIKSNNPMKEISRQELEELFS